jgi:hypothetical protein
VSLGLHLCSPPYGEAAGTRPPAAAPNRGPRVIRHLTSNRRASPRLPRNSAFLARIGARFTRFWLKSALLSSAVWRFPTRGRVGMHYTPLRVESGNGTGKAANWRGRTKGQIGLRSRSARRSVASRRPPSLSRDRRGQRRDAVDRGSGRCRLIRARQPHTPIRYSKSWLAWETTLEYADFVVSPHPRH